jgi:hypothetical protein
MATYTPAASGTFPRDLDRRLDEKVSVLNFIPESLHAGIRDFSGTTDVSTYIQAAETYLAGLVSLASPDSGMHRGSTLWFPRGRYYCTSTINKARFISWKGEGIANSVLLWPASFTGHGVFRNNTPDGESAMKIEGLTFFSERGSATSTKGAYYDVGSVNWQIENCSFRGFKYGVIADRSELLNIRYCNFEALQTGIWWVNGPDASLGNTASVSGVTNHNGVEHSTFNGCSGICIIDDGGEGRWCRFNNFNSGTRMIRASGVTHYVITGNYCEGITSAPLWFTWLTLDGDSNGPCSAVDVSSNIFGMTSTAFGPIQADSLGLLVFRSNVVSGSGAACIGGAYNTAHLQTFGNASGRPLTDGMTTMGIYHVAETRAECSVAADVGSIAAGAAAYVEVPLPAPVPNFAGYAVGDVVESITTSVDLGDAIVLTARISALNKARVRLHNISGSPVDPPSCIYRVTVRQRIG